MKLVIKITIQQSLDVVFNYITDPRNEPNWNTDLERVEDVDPQAWDVGSTATMIFGPRADAIEITVTDITPNKRYSFESQHGTSTYLFKGNDERTRILFETEIVVRGLLMQTLKRAALKRTLEERLEANFRALKAVLETPVDGYADEGYADESVAPESVDEGNLS